MPCFEKFTGIRKFLNDMFFNNKGKSQIFSAKKGIFVQINGLIKII